MLVCPIQSASNVMASADVNTRGAVFTRREVVDFILDISGYDENRPLHTLRLLEPSFGHGDFLLPAIDRLLSAWRKSGAQVTKLKNAIRGIELHHSSTTETRRAVISRLLDEGLDLVESNELADNWLHQGDFLLADIDGQFDFVVGNPPYVRQELISDTLMAEYRRRYHTIFDRADIYIPFIERSLKLLRKQGRCGFICSDRWMKNKYGGPLRNFVSQNFCLKAYIDMVDTPAFHADVVTYPAITVISYEKSGPTRIAYRPQIDRSTLKTLAKIILRKNVSNHHGSGVIEKSNVATNSEPWLFDSSSRLDLVRRLESDFSAIQDVGCKVGIGVATGADKAFIGQFDNLEVEASRKLPLVRTQDIKKGDVQWQGLGVINPFGEDGKLVDLDKFPKLKFYLSERKDQISKRHIALKNPVNWYRTIDRIYPPIAKTPKLLIPDIKGDAHIVYEDGTLYPHHNLYFITSDDWHIRALQTVLTSGIARLFVEAYSTQMRGGYFRFQAQYLRRIRLPKWTDVSDGLREKLIDASDGCNASVCNQIVSELYGLSDDEQKILAGVGF